MPPTNVRARRPTRHPMGGRAPVRVIEALMVAAAVAGCYSPTDYDRRPSGVTLRVSRDSAPADGASLVIVKLAAPLHIQSGLTAVLSAASGTLIGASQGTLTLPLAGGDTVRARWQAPLSTGFGYLVAKVGSILVLQDSVVFVAAGPDSVEVDPAAPAVKGTADAEVTVNVHLRRTVGTPSLGTRVTVTADTAGVAFGRVLSTTPSDAAGLVTARFAPGETTYRRTVTITATVTVGGSTHTGSTVVTITE